MIGNVTLHKRLVLIRKRFQFSIRTALVAITLLAPLCIYIGDYLMKRSHPDFVLPTPSEYAEILKEWQLQNAARGTVTVPTKKKPSAHAQDLVESFPPRGLEYWKSQAKKIEPGMHEWALYRHVPPANIGTSFLRPQKNTQVFVYAVDSELAAMCEVTVKAGTAPSFSSQVVRFHGFVEHNLAYDEWGSLDADKITFDDDDQARVTFVVDGA